MAGRGLQEQLTALREAVADPRSKAARERIVRALRGRRGVLIAAATEAIAPEDVGPRPTDAALLAELPAAFARLLVDAVKRDPQCVGKTAIARCLRRAEQAADEVFVTGARHVQLEPVWGGRVDTAAQLRGICVMALVEQQHPRAMVEAAQRLADPEIAARTAAARALGVSGRPEVAEPLLRLRIDSGEPEPGVLEECFGALLSVAPETSVDYVAAGLRVSDAEQAGAAALALGQSRLEAAFEPLRSHAETLVTSGTRRVVMLAIAMLRDDRAWDWLLQRVEQGGAGEALDAMQALGAFVHDARLRERLRSAVVGRDDDVLVLPLRELLAGDAG